MTRYTFDEVRAALRKHWNFSLQRGGLVAMFAHWRRQLDKPLAAAHVDNDFDKLCLHLKEKNS